MIKYFTSQLALQHYDDPIHFRGSAEISVKTDSVTRKLCFHAKAAIDPDFVSTQLSGTPHHAGQVIYLASQLTSIQLASAA